MELRYIYMEHKQKQKFYKQAYTAVNLSFFLNNWSLENHIVSSIVEDVKLLHIDWKILNHGICQ